MLFLGHIDNQSHMGATSADLRLVLKRVTIRVGTWQIVSRLFVDGYEMTGSKPPSRMAGSEPMLFYLFDYQTVEKR